MCVRAPKNKAASKRCFYEPIKWHHHSIAWGTPEGEEQLKVVALQWPLCYSGITHKNFFSILLHKRSIIHALVFPFPLEQVGTIIFK